MDTVVPAQTSTRQDPEISRMVDEEIGDQIVNQAIGVGIGVEPPVLIAREAAGRADPKRAILPCRQRGNGIRRRGAVLPIEPFECIAVEARQSLIGTEPEVSVVGLRDRAYSILRQSI